MTGILNPERMLEVIAPNVPSEFPLPKSLDDRPHNLPAQATPFIGRESDISSIKQELAHPAVRLLTLTGVGGTGKTRLALQVAAELLDDFDDGVFFVALASVSDAALVIPTIAQTLGVREAPGRPFLESLKDFLRDKQLLLLLDNFEQVITAAPLVGELLNDTHHLRILVTSREVLRVYGEHAYPLSPLVSPDPQHLPPLDRLAQVEAVRLFIERARAVTPNFGLSDENASAVAEICYRLDGLPLAIELAAARVRLLPPQKMLAQMDNRLRFLTGGARDLPARQQTLRGTIDWSYELLTDSEKLLFRRLAVFSGGFTLEAAESICNPDGQQQVLNDMQSLLDKSLIKQSEAAGEPRFDMLETIREYAHERLTISGELGVLQERHLDFFLELVESADPHLVRQEKVRWLNRLEMEHENLRAALAWSRTAEGYAARGLRLAGRLAGFWSSHNHYREGLQHLLAALARTGTLDPTARGRALYGAALLSYNLGDFGAARSLSEASVSEYRALGPDGRQELAKSILLLGYLESEVGDYATALTRIETSLGIMREQDDPPGIAAALRDLGTCLLRMGDFEAAGKCLQEALSIFRQMEYPYDSTMVLTGLAEIALRRGDYERAEALEQQSLALRRELGDKWGISVSLGNLAWILLRQGDLHASASRLADSLSLRRKIGDSGGVAWCLEKTAELALTIVQRESAPRSDEGLRRAVQLFGAAASVRAPFGSTMDLVDRPAYERQLGVLRAQFGEATFAALWAAGQSMSLEQAIVIAEEIFATAQSVRPPATAAAPYPAGLSAREVEVLRLVAQGLTDAQIAQTLVISRRTVGGHLRSIYGKLNVSNRTAAARFAAEQKLR